MDQNQTTSSTVLLNGEQAKAELAAIEAKIASIRKSMREMKEIGDVKGWDKLNKELSKTQREMRQVQKESFDAKKVLDNLSGSSLKDLETAQKKIQNLMRNGTVKRHTKDWEELREANIRVKKEIKSVNDEMQIGESKTSKFANGFNKYFAAVTAGIAALTGITFALKQFVQLKNDKEESAANLKALTGLDDNSITWLVGQAELLSTKMTESGVRIRKSSKEILDAFTVVGSAKPELLKNKEALSEVTQQAMILAEASKMDLNEAVRGLTVAMNMYGASAKEASRYTNVLGAGAKEGAAEVDSQTQAILKSGVAASQAGIPIEQLVGSIQTLAEKGIKDEIAGTGLKTFFIKLQSGADDTNPKIVGLQKALENLAAKNLSAAEIQKQFGLETYTVATAMIANAKKVDFYTKAVTGTSTALDQARINSQTSAAKLAQVKNEFNEAGMRLVKNLNPALLSALSLTTKVVKGMAAVADASNATKRSFEEQKTKVINLMTNIEPLLQRYDELAKKTNRSASENAELKKIIDKVAQAVPGAVTAVDKYGNAIAISTSRVQEYITAQMALYKVKFRDQIKAQMDALKDVETQIAFHEKRIQEINKTGTFKVKTVSDKKTGDVYDVFATSEEIKKEQDLYKELIQQRLGYKEYIKELDGTTLAQEIKNAQAAREAEIKAAEEARIKEEEEAKKNADSKSTTLQEQKNSIELVTQEIDKAHNQRLAKLKKARTDENQTDAEYNDAILAEDQAYYTLKIAALEKFLKTVKDKGLKSDIEKEIAELQNKMADQEMKFQQRISQIILDADPLKKENTEYEERLRIAGLFGIEKEEMTADQLAALELLEKQHNDNIFNIQQSAKDKEKSQLEKTFKEEYKATKEKYLSEIDLLQQQADFAKSLGSPFAELDNIEEDPEILVIRKRIEAINTEIAARKKAGIETAELTSDLIQNETDLTQVYIEKFNQRAALFSQFGERIGNTVGELINGNKDAFKSGLASIINLGLDYLKAQAQMAIAGATFQSLTQPDSIATFGATGIARAAILTGLIEVAFATAKTVIGNAISGDDGYFSGGYRYDGYTGGSDPREVRGRFPDGSPYHGMEYIADHRTTRNPVFKKVFDLAEYAKRNNTIASITSDDIIRSISSRSGGYYSKGSLSSSGVKNVTDSNADYSKDIIYALRESSAVNSLLTGEIRKGIKAKTYVTGKGGINEAVELYDKMIKNATR